MLKPGDAVDRYVIESLLGTGGMGAVYRAHDPRLDRSVALKVVHADKDAGESSRTEATARLLREARAAAKLQHPNAINIYDVGEAGGDAFIVMELVPGRTLLARLDDGSLARAEKVRVLADVARALAAAHRAGIVHRDVKPENIMIRHDGAVKVLDFGIARRAASALDPTAPTQQEGLLTLTAEGVRVGTPLYMTPEQIRGEALDGRSDQFAWGVVAWEVFRGSLPWKKTDAMSLAGEILLQPVGPAGAGAIDPVIARCLAKSPADRFASMAEVVAALDREAVPGASVPSSASGSGSPPASAPPPPRPAEATALPFNRYSTEMTRAILSRAIERQAEGPAAAGYASEDILAAAREVGVDEDAVRAAERELSSPAPRQTRALSPRANEWRKLLQHLVAYAAVNVFLLVTLGWWLDKWVLFGWGIGVASHLAKVLFPTNEQEAWRETRRRGRRRGRDRGQQGPGARVDPEVERAADALVQTAAARRLRVAPVSARVSSAAGKAERGQAEELEAEVSPGTTSAKERRA